MIKKLLLNFNIDSRQLIASKLVIVFSLSATSFFSIYNFLDGNSTLFYIDSTLFLLLLVLNIFLIKKDIYLLSKISIIIMLVGLIFIVYNDEGRNNTYLWAFVAMFYLMFMFGPKKGIIYTSLFLLVIFYLMHSFIGDSITQQGYVRFMFISITLVVVAFAYEYSISGTLSRLEKVQKELTNMTITDSLTTLYNRRYFDEIFPNQIKIAKRNSRLLIFAMADIDGFKNYNDTYGHQAGDEVLKEVSFSFLNAIHRPDDYVFRLGGEEFGILFLADTQKDALNVVKKICSNIENLKIAHSDNIASPYVTASIGVCIIKPIDSYDYDHIYKSTDDALYGAKQKGKNRVELA